MSETEKLKIGTLYGCDVNVEVPRGYPEEKRKMLRRWFDRAARALSVPVDLDSLADMLPRQRAYAAEDWAGQVFEVVIKTARPE